MLSSRPRNTAGIVGSGGCFRVWLLLTFLVLGALLPSSARAEFGISMSGTSVTQGRVKPGQTVDTPYAAQLTVHSSAPWTLQVMAPPEFVTLADPELTMPIERQAWRIHAAGGAFTQFVAGIQTILGAQAPTPPSGTTTVLDFRLSPEFADRPTPEDGSNPYRAVLVYTVTAGTIDASYAAPNPFSPDGDGVNDRTDIHWYQGVPRVVDVMIYRADGTTPVRTLVVRSPFTPGDRSVTWDGRDDDRNLVPEGDYMYRVVVNANEAVDPGLTLASGLIGVERGATTGSGVIIGQVTSSQGYVPVPNATVRLRRAGGLVVNTQTTDGVGNFAIAMLPTGYYTLEVSAPLHFPYVSETFELVDGQTLRHDVLLVHNHSLTISKRADVTDVEPGDVVTYEVRVSTQGGVETVENVMVDDDLPAGLRLVSGSARIDGKRVPGDSDATPDVLRGHRVRFPLGTIPPNTVVVLTYDATVVAGTKPGRLRNAAKAWGMVGSIRVETGVTSALIYVHDGETGDRSLVFGRLYVDVDGNGRYDKGDRIPTSARVVVDDGTVIIADQLGRYSVKGLRDGRRAVMAVIDADPDSPAKQLVPSGASRVELVDLVYGAPRKIDFAFTPEEIDRYKGGAAAKTSLAVIDVRVGLDRVTKGNAAPETVLTLLGRTAAFFEWDLGDKYRITGALDTRREPRDELGITRDQLSFQPETGDNSTMTPPPVDKIGVRLKAPWGGALIGRTGVSFNDTDLVASTRSFLGAEATYSTKKVSVRAFGGRADTLLRLERVPNDGTTGPYRLQSFPILRGNVQMFVETYSAAGEFVGQLALTEGTDYELDYTYGLLFLNRPYPVTSPAGETTVFAIQYEYAPESEIPPAWIGGGRVEVRMTKQAAVGTSLLSEQGEPDSKTVAGLDARWQGEQVEGFAEVARSTPGPTLHDELPSDDPNAARIRATVRPRDDLRLFGFASQIGGAYNQQVNFRTRTPAGQAFGYLPPPSQSLFPPMIRALSDGQRDFPFTLVGAPDRREIGLGSQWSPTPGSDVTAGGSYTARGLEDSAERQSASTYFVTGRYVPKQLPTVFIAGLEERDQINDANTHSLMLGSRYMTNLYQIDGEYRFRDREQAPPEGDIVGHGALLRGKYLKWQKVQPAVMLEASRDVEQGTACQMDVRGCVFGETEVLSAGAEGRRKELGYFGYGSYGRVIDRQIGPFALPRRGAFAGVTYTGERLSGTARFDLFDDYLLGLQYGGAARFRMVFSRSLAAFVSLQYKSGTDPDPRSQWFHVAGLAIRPFQNDRLFVFLKYRDRKFSGLSLEAGSRRSLLGTADIVVPLGKRFQLGTRLGGKSASSLGGPARLAMIGEELTYHLSRRWDVITGLRWTTTGEHGESVLGATAGLGYWLTEGLRFVAGVNHARTEWAFEADDSIPGVFMNLTGVYGSAGAPAELQ